MSVDKKQYAAYIKKRGSYTLVPNEIWELVELDPFDKMIWCYIVSKKPDWGSSRNNLARNLGISRQKVSDAIKKLQSYNLLEVTNGANNSWSFKLNEPSQWTTATPAGGIPGSPAAGTTGAHTKEDNTPNTNNSIFSQEGSIYGDPSGATGDRRAVGNMHLPGKIRSYEDTQFISLEAELKYKDYVARGITPADINGLSLVEYANQRAYAEGFETIRTTPPKSVDTQNSDEFDQALASIESRDEES